VSAKRFYALAGNKMRFEIGNWKLKKKYFENKKKPQEVIQGFFTRSFVYHYLTPRFLAAAYNPRRSTLEK
jgi:hypothetical protein